MATSEIYFLNGPTLSSSTAVFLDNNLSICAPDGFYSDGTIVREQVDCVLLPEVICPSCTVPCGLNISATQLRGIYYINTNTGPNTGAIVIRFNPLNAPDGIIAQLGPNSYNGVSSQNAGWLQGLPLGEPTYLGNSASDCNIVSNSPHANVDRFQYQDGSFAPLGTTETINVVSSQTLFTPFAPGICTMVIPKTVTTYPTLNIDIIGLCTETLFNIEISCPEQLDTWVGSFPGSTSQSACLLGLSTDYYYVHVNGSGGVLGLYDIVFSDPNGANPLPLGYYNTGNMSLDYDWIFVSNNGVVTEFGLCAEPVKYLIERCYDGLTAVFQTSGTFLPGDSIVVNEYPGCVWTVVEETTLPVTATFNSIPLLGCESQCATWQLINLEAEVNQVTYIDCNGNEQQFNLQPNDSIVICARYMVETPIAVDVNLLNCNCTSGSVNKYVIQSCCNPEIVFVAYSTLSVSISNLVKISTPDFDGCWFEVMELTNAIPQVMINQVSAALECQDICCRYRVRNEEPTETYSVTYKNCAGVSGTITLNPGQQTPIFCARANSFSATSLTIIPIDCICT
jgi:hypothetical protein